MKKALLTIISFIGVIVSTFVLTACNNQPVILDSLQNDYGVVVEGGKFEEGSILVSNSVTLASDEGKEVLDILSNQDYNKAGNIYIFDIYVSKDGKRIQPDGKVKVTIPVTELDNDNYFVFHIKENNSVEKLIPIFLEGNVSFETSSFSYFAIVEEAIKEHVHSFNEWTPDQTTENKHTRECGCGEKETGDCTFDEGKVTQEATHFEEGIKTYTCTICGRTKEESIEKTAGHSFGEWTPDQTTENKHIRECKCGEKETGDCTFDEGKVTKEATDFEEGIKTYTCTVCGRTKEESIEKTAEHSFGEWTPDQTTENKHTRECGCGEKETGDCTFDEGKVTKNPTHFEEGVKTYTCTICGRTKEESIEKTAGHSFGEWTPDQTTENKHTRVCNCGESETADCTFDEGKVTKNPTHFEEGVKTYTCTVCGRTKEESIEKTAGHSFGEWTPDQTTENKHIRECGCGEKETGDCTFDEGKVTKNPTHFEEGVKTYTCTVCGRTKEESIEKTTGHSFGEWTPDQTTENKHTRVCNCGESETADCTFDEGKVTKNPTHFEEGVKTYTCTVCGRTKEESIEKTAEHSFGEWTPDQTTENKHIRECKCGEKEIGDCIFDEGTPNEEKGVVLYTCTICGRTKEEIKDSIEGIIIVIANGTATFEGKETVTSDSKLYGENANVYITQVNDVLNVSLTEKEGRVFKYWVSATGTIIPDKDFSLLVFRSGYYYPVFEDADVNDFSNRIKIFEGNCEEGVLYMSTNSKGDVKYELELINGGHHDFYDYEQFNNQYHSQKCNVCGETIYEEHTEYDREIVKEAGHTEEGQMKYECFCGHEWYESIPVTEEHTIDYDDWHIIEKSENGNYGKYRVYCKYCDYYEEYWYLDNLDFIGFMDNAMINYQYTYGGKVCHNEYYYSYTNAAGQKVYIWAFQYEYENSSNADYNDTYIFMYIDDEDSTTLEPIYLSKSKGDRRAEYLWAIYGYAYDVNDWIEILDSPDFNIGCENGMLLSNSMSARSSVFESYHDYWAETYNKLRIPTTKEYNDLSETPWEIEYEGKSFQGGYYDENGEYVTTGGRDVIFYVKDKGTSYKKYMYVDKETGITYGYEDFGTYYRTTFIMRTYKAIVSPEEFDKLDAAGKSVVYSYGDIEKDIKSLCSKRTLFNNFTLTLPETTSAFRLLFSDSFDCVEISGSNVNVYNNSAYVYNSGSPITFTWEGKEGIVFDRYEIWDFENQKWVTLSESATYIFNSSTDPRRDAAYIRVICHEVEVPVEPSEMFRISVENGYFEIDGEIHYGAVEVPANTHVYVYANDVDGKTFEYWLDSNGEKFNNYHFYVTSNMTLTPVYTDRIYNQYCEGWNYNSYVIVNGGEKHYSTEIEGKEGTTFELNTTYDPNDGCTVFIGWYMEIYGLNGREYVLISDKQAFTFTITDENTGFLYAVWTTGENPFIKKYVDIRVVNGFVIFSGGEGVKDTALDNAYSAISVSNMGRIEIFDDPTDEKTYTFWDITYKYELEGELIHEICESFGDEYGYYPAGYWVNDPQYSYPDGEINIIGIDNPDYMTE